MSRKLIPTLAAVLLVSAFALPLSAQPEPGRAEPLSLLARLWERIAALFDASETDGRGGWDPDGLDSDGLSGFDPDGLTSDGRSGWDPNG
jgi:hypothetical protein